VGRGEPQSAHVELQKRRAGNRACAVQRIEPAEGPLARVPGDEEDVAATGAAVNDMAAQRLQHRDIIHLIHVAVALDAMESVTRCPHETTPTFHPMRR